MKRTRINIGTVGIVTRKGDYDRTLVAGLHWLGFGEDVAIYKMDRLYTSDFDLTIMLKDQTFRSLVEVVTVNDDQICLRYENGHFVGVVTSGRFFYFKGLLDIRLVSVDLNDAEVDERIPNFVRSHDSVRPFIRSFEVLNHEEALLMVDGEFRRSLSRGVYYFWKNNTPIDVLKADTRNTQLEISGQEILTKDKAALRVNYYAQYRIVDIKRALIENKDYERQLYILIQLALREFIGTLTLDELLDNKEAVSTYVAKRLSEKTADLGVAVSDSGIRDLILPGDVKEIMNRVLIAQKQAQANTITRREETASTRSLLNTAKLMEDNEMLFKLKEMEYVEKIAEKIGEISVSGGHQVLDQLRGIFTSKGK